MSSNKRIRYAENGFYIIIWLVVILSPFFISPPSGNREWSFVFNMWKRLLPFAIIFIINNFCLAPKFLLKGKIWIYLACCAVLVGGMIVVDNHYFKKEKMAKIHMLHQQFEAEFPPLPDEFDNDFPAPEHHFEKPPFGKKGLREHKNTPRPPLVPFGLAAITILILGFNSGIKTFVRWTEEKSLQTEKEKQHLMTELAYLRNQISPHFFMNTLNNIHALVDIDGEKAKEAIIKLSRLMRYLLYEPEGGLVSLGKEISFLESYIELMRLRYDENMLDAKMEYPDSIDRAQVPPFLFLSFVENAFKYGINPRGKSSINIRFEVEKKYLLFSIRNHTFVKAEAKLDEGSGIGLENIKKRLQLIYHNSYFLNIDKSNDLYTVELRIPTNA